MRYHLLFSLALATFTVSLATADLREVIQRQYDSISRDFEKADFVKLRSLMSPDCTATAQGKTAHRDAILRDFQGIRRRLKSVTWTRHVERVKAQGRDCVASVSGQVNGILITADRKSHHFTLQSKAEDTWTQASGTWLLKKSVTTKLVVSIDGHPIPQG